MNRPDDLEERLRDTFRSTADDYRTAPLPRDLWSRGRAPQRRGVRPELVAAAVVLVALLASVVVLTRPDALVRPADAPPGGALPTDAYVPDDLEGLRVETSVPEGTKASVVAMTGERSVALLVDARTGEHHLVDLEAALGTTLDSRTGRPVLALSPDGTRLAAAVLEENGPPGDEATGVAILDLATTAVSTKFLTSTTWPIEVRDLSWSASSGTLAWLGNEYEPTVGPRGQEWVGTIVSGATSQWKAPRRVSFYSAAAVDGGGYLLGSEHVWAFGSVEDGGPARLPVEFDGSVVADGSRLVVAQPYGEPQVVTLDLDAPGDEPRTDPWPSPPESLGPSLAGLTPDGAVVGLLESEEVTARAMDRSGAVTTLTTVHGVNDENHGVYDENPVEMAVALADTAAVDFAAPPWAPGPPWWVKGGLLLVAGLGIAFIAVRWRRRHARHGGERTEPAGPRQPRLIGPFEVVVSLALAGGLAVAVAPMVPHGSATEHPDGVLPTTLYSPTGYSSDWRPVNMTTRDFALGRASMAQLTEGGLLVLVDASDGTHRLVSLPERNSIWYGIDGSTPDPVALSPDGAQLAFTWEHLSKTTDQTTAGLAVLDLESGTVRKVSLRGRNDRPVRVSDIAWSRDASHLMWVGDEAVQWDMGVSSFQGPWRRVGVTAAADLTDRGADMRTTHDVAIAVTPDGSGYALSSAANGIKDLVPGTHLWTLEPGAKVTEAPSRKIADAEGMWNNAVLSQDEGTLVVGTNNHDNVDPYAAGLRTLDLTDPDSRLEVDLWDVSRSGSRTMPLGLTDDGALVVAHEGDDGEEWVSRWDDGEVTPVTQVQGEGRSLTVATELADSSASFPEPTWPVSDERLWSVALLAMALVFSLVLPVTRLVRRRRARQIRTNA